MRPRATVSIVAILISCAGAARAGRPLATDDAAVADRGACQIEAWVERAADQRALVFAPACGVADGWEIGADATRTRPRGDTIAALGLAAKWAPKGSSFETAFARVALGAKFAAATDRLAGGDWRMRGANVLGLASLEFTDRLALHLNVGAARDRPSRTTGTLFNAALEWSPAPRWMVFGEALANDRRATFGGTVSSAGARWWIVPEAIGLDFTASREAGAGDGTRWGFGIGWYGLGR